MWPEIHILPGDLPSSTAIITLPSRAPPCKPLAQKILPRIPCAATKAGGAGQAGQVEAQLLVSGPLYINQISGASLHMHLPL